MTALNREVTSQLPSGTDWRNREKKVVCTRGRKRISCGGIPRRFVHTRRITPHRENGALRKWGDIRKEEAWPLSKRSMFPTRIAHVEWPTWTHIVVFPGYQGFASFLSFAYLRACSYIFVLSPNLLFLITDDITGVCSRAAAGPIWRVAVGSAVKI